MQKDRCDDILTHLFMHQTRHRGQVHSMLSGASIIPPQLDEFIVGTMPEFANWKWTR